MSPDVDAANTKTQTTNPALLRLLGAHTILLLQGPVGPFFDRLTFWLQSQGKQVERVIFQGGDRWDCKAVNPIAYYGTPQAWRGFFSRLLNEVKPDCIVLFGQSRHYHTLAIEVAKARGISLVVLEEGYFRPGYVTMELGGVNGYSTTLEKYRWEPPAEAARVAIAPDISSRHFVKMAWHAAQHYLALWLERTQFPHYKHHRNANPFHYAGYWLRSWRRKFVRRWPDRAFQAQLFGSAQPYFFVPLQHDGDAQITHHSPFEKNTEFIITVLRSFARHAPDDALLIFRQHPHSRGGPGHAKFIYTLANELGVRKRVHHLAEGDTPDLCQHSAGVVLINSTVGLQALERGAPLMVLGDALYKLPHLTHPGGLDSFWQEAVPPPIDATREFLMQMKNLTQSPCSVYALRNEPLNWPQNNPERKPEC